ncbi:Uu.00g104480.m01.CDS01 [Anthostomella pinea]|uniref:Uu.00g104480.m01.CDS01 n=1 Tax=Anthostomella pinea TaxID=933095 RepID=A0AAI8VEG4_9PEZI|nr:Uu.00g104480.m01.CDS01 [Anthostomella pinea]
MDRVGYATGMEVHPSYLLLFVARAPSRSGNFSPFSPGPLQLERLSLGNHSFQLPFARLSTIMSLHLPARRAVQSARATVGQPSLHLSRLLPKTQRRNAWFNGWGSQSSSSKESPLAKELTKRERQQKMADRMFNRTQGSTIFDEEIKDAEQPGQDASKEIAAGSTVGFSKMKEHMERALDPDPRWRVRYQKKKVMQMVRADGKLTHKERIKQSEKEVHSASPPLPTSTKKLVKLSHQIVGKTIDDAITQMRYSKKKIAKEVKWQLEEARDSAIASRGMGLGVHTGEVLRTPKKIQTKDGRWIEVQDPTQLYIDESWVAKGPYRGVRIQYHARARMSRMWRPTTSINVVLKEEKTRIRQHDDRVEKQAKKAPWIHLPNRPVTAQRQYYCW